MSLQRIKGGVLVLSREFGNFRCLKEHCNFLCVFVNFYKNYTALVFWKTDLMA